MTLRMITKYLPFLDWVVHCHIYLAITHQRDFCDVGGKSFRLIP